MRQCGLQSEDVTIAPDGASTVAFFVCLCVRGHEHVR